MLKWNVESGVVAELSYKEKNLILPWGIETADAWGFFSLEKGIGYRHEILSESDYQVNSSSETKLKVQMPEGPWNLEVKNQLSEHHIVRETRLSPEGQSWHMDFVMRYRFLKENFEEALIGDQRLGHRGTNVYYQYPVKEVKLLGKHLNAHISVTDFHCPKGFKLLMYVRDYQNEWIVHIRFLPVTQERLVIKLCNRWYKTRPIPQFVTDELLKSDSLKERLLYRSERRPYKNKVMRLICPNAFPLEKLSGSDSFWIKSECRFYEP